MISLILLEIDLEEIAAEILEAERLAEWARFEMEDELAAIRQSQIVELED